MPTPLRRRLRLARRGAWYALAVTLVGVALLVALFSQLLPLAERHPDRIEAWLSERAGRPVAFDRVQTQWTRRGPLLQLEGLRVGEADAGVSIGQAEVLVAMYGGLLPGRSFTELRLRGLSLTLERAEDGAWNVHGLPGQQAGGDPLDALKGLGELQIVDGALVIAAPSLGREIHLPRIDLRLRVDGDRLRAGARAWSRPEGQPLQANLDFDRATNSGRAYAGLDSRNLGEWQALLDLGGIAVVSGSGTLRAWAEVEQRRLVSLVSDLRLQSLELKGAPLDGVQQTPSLEFGRLDASTRWQRTQDGWRFDAPMLRVGSGAETQTLDGLTFAGGKRFAMVADTLDAGPLLSVAGLSDRLSPQLRHWLMQAAPRGSVSGLSIAGEQGGAMQLHAQLSGLGFGAVGDAPGVDGLAGRLQGDGQGFVLDLAEDATVRFDWPSGFGVVHDVSLQGQLVGWRDDGWRIGTSALRLKGSDYGAHVRGNLWFQTDGQRPRIDIAADIDDAPVIAAKRFWVHHRMPEAAIEWLDAALMGGWVREGHAVVSGDLDDWPFTGTDGRFEARGRIDDGQFRFQPDWPELDGVAADVAFIGNGFDIHGKGDLMGVDIGHFSAAIEDFSEAELKIQAKSESEASRLLAMLRQSSLQRTHGDTMDHLVASGPVKVDFELLQPLHQHRPVQRKLGGMVELRGAKLAEKRWDVAFEDVRGVARYDQGGFVAEQLAVKSEGRPGQLSLRAGSGALDKQQAFEGELSTTLQADELLARAPRLAWLEPHVDGVSEWTVAVAIPAGNAGTGGLTLRSDMVGTTLALPEPLAKPAAAKLPVSVKTTLPLEKGPVDVVFGDVLALRADMASDKPGLHVVLGGGDLPKAMPATGLTVTGSTPRLDALGWVAMVQRGEGEGGLSLRHADVLADTLLIAGSGFPQTRLQAAPADAAMAITLDGPALSGGLLVTDEPHMAVTGRLQRLHWRPVAAGNDPADTNTHAGTIADFDPAKIPALALEVDDLRFGQAALGNASLRTQPVAGGLQVEKLQLRAPKQQIDLTGTWSGTGNSARTRMDVQVKSQDFGALSDNLGFKGRVGGGHGTASVQVAWPGSPAQFRLEALEGSVVVSARDGSLLEVEPGAGRMLGLLSVAEVRRRLMLDFSDFFSKGFAFNRIDGSVQLGGGLARSEDLVIDGPSAEMRIRGHTDLKAEQFDQTIEVLPKSANVLTAVGAVAGGPLGAAVGAVANAVLQKPLSEMGAKTYHVSGPWKQPRVEVLQKEQSRANTNETGGRVRAP